MACREGEGEGEGQSLASKAGGAVASSGVSSAKAFACARVATMSPAS